jgi:predicted oxidoreductase
MRFTLLIVFFTVLSFSASAQWWHIRLKKLQTLPLIEQPVDHSISRIAFTKPVFPGKITYICFSNQSDYSLELAESRVMRQAQHNMRFRIYDAASYNFSDLADLYIKQNRLSEAKWYYLQSNNISRQQNDDKHTISNLMALAMIKANMGDVVMAQQDLAEARQMAVLRNWTPNVASIDREVKFIQQNKSTASKTELRYADAVTFGKKDKKTD